MKTIVVYTSQTGFTKRYAEWIAQEVGAELCTLAQAKKKDVSGYDAIIFGGWACAGSIHGISWFKKHINQWKGKKLIAFCVGASPSDNPEIEQALNKNFTAEERRAVNVFYCPGGLNYAKMPAPSRIMLKLFYKTLNAKKDKTEQEIMMMKVLLTSYDISDKACIAPILACLTGKNAQSRR